MPIGWLDCQRANTIGAMRRRVLKNKAGYMDAA